MKVQHFGQKALNWLLPNHCYLCDEPCAAPLCEACEHELPRIQQHCSICALPLPHNGICAECQRRKPSFDRCLCAFQYTHHIPSLIHHFKHHRTPSLGRWLTKPLIEQFTNSPHKPDALIAVPMHWRHRLWRGFNQADVIAKAISVKTHIPIIHPIQKVQANRHQQQLSRKQRLLNNRLAFAVVAPIPYRHIALVDDVVTTGATAEIISALLKRAGVQQVTLCTLARTPKPN